MMSKIIKKNDVDDNVSLETLLDMKELAGVFDEDDQKILSPAEAAIKVKAREILQKAIKDAQIIRKHAKKIYLQVQDKQEEARKAGFEQGRMEGLASVTESMARVLKMKEELVNKLERHALTLVYDIAQKIVGETLKLSDESLVSMVKQALQSVMGNELTLYVSPPDYERIKKHSSQLMSVLQATQTIQIKPSEHVKPNGCIIESELGTIDAQLEYQLEAIRKALEIGEA